MIVITSHSMLTCRRLETVYHVVALNDPCRDFPTTSDWGKGNFMYGAKCSSEQLKVPTMRSSTGGAWNKAENRG